ncbi:MAG: hypothetical protein A3C85_03160 [Candidatus Doudnabacteria bacterium RIFCSPHIGHO2_02_FULL_48_21]|uniref:Response regulatory domain-containing protein n=1 Tax=Candidatus Doudnabacteria bacterium RIFCSPLOWO2_02_FULL_48_13 TaxID=1817845 RepID=A0A1F5QCB8_9BACT|nr:MAG: hypothetical protein A3K05_02390 [Candidatus Doudnabacteria bacterium RIFCSPHIGHO2_01_48_18]OGE80056.1 MAG: hypothetical protein A2668_03995 [Candidatus Doudnabacteria bacterium RIFCSPHIGHO2_01_FULL_48_180]OGE91272.1 MAG: hypothetical protein A3F44_04590 [Candidatus Doudnabacteria bacterium RIFCSPHIGHO2_12_FULL_47_25]OGE93527.1 MAG: hypothetical protein A3C85_03160 [Candidatus Doudnabacteria bacterium RIFCSPHIGHO2_02_FULL_48_21]OGE96303.1 MAG: hypothetical protein A3A83_01875 [Candidatu
MAKILVVEDELMMRDLVVRKLNSAGFDVKIAADGKEALGVWRSEAPDLVLLDLVMPEMDGFEVLKQMRSDPNPGLANTQVIVLSNLWSNEDILKAQNLKIQGYLVKAYYTPEDILQKVNEVLKK